jgi:serine O-acetyltransferase
MTTSHACLRTATQQPRPRRWFEDVRADLRRTYSYLDGSRPRRIAACLATPGVQAVLVYRLGRWLQSRPVGVRALVTPAYYALNLAVRCLWGIDIPRGCRIGPGLYIGHFGGITLSPSAVIGSNCNLSHDVTIGIAGQGPDLGSPVIGDDVYIAPGAKLFGKIRVGDNVKIGANAVVYRDVPDNAVVVLDPGFRVISLKGNRGRRAAQQAARAA